MTIVALAGGVGGAKLAHGLQLALDDPRYLSIIGNTADDFSLYGLHISPDLDTVLYTLSGLANPVTGWGIGGDTFTTLGMIGRYTGAPWFQLGDQDLGTHIVRTAGLREGKTLTEVTAGLATALEIGACILPMTDDPVATEIGTADGWLEFQEYFVGRRHADTVTGVRFAGIEHAVPTDAVVAAIADADAIIFCPSNPIVSIGPILSVPGMRAALEAAAAPIVAVSPIIGGAALKGPAAEMLQSLNHEVSALGVARIYADLIDVFVLDNEDAALADDVARLGLTPVVTNTIMKSDADRWALAQVCLAAAQR